MHCSFIVSLREFARLLCSLSQSRLCVVGEGTFWLHNGPIGALAWVMVDSTESRAGARKLPRDLRPPVSSHGNVGHRTTDP